MNQPPHTMHNAHANVAAIKAIPPIYRHDGMEARDASTGKVYFLDADSVLGASSSVLVPDAGPGRWILDERALVADLASTTTGKGASTIGIEDAATIFTATNVEAALAEVKTIADATKAAAPGMQAAAATLVAGTVTINTVITVAASSEVVPILIGAITGSTNFASLRELKSSRVNGAPGVGTLVIEAVGADGAKDVDAAGAIRVLIFTPQS